MAAPDPRRRSLYARLEEVLGPADAEILMTYLPPHPGTELATRADIADLSTRMDRRFGRVDERFEQMEQRFVQMEQRFDRRFERLDDRFLESDRRFERMDERFGQVRHDLRDQLKVYTTTTIGAMAALTAIYAGIVAIAV